MSCFLLLSEYIYIQGTLGNRCDSKRQATLKINRIIIQKYFSWQLCYIALRFDIEIMIALIIIIIIVIIIIVIIIIIIII